MRQIGKRLFLGGALMVILGSAYADNASVSVKTCDPYQDYSCLDSALGTGFWNRLTNYYKLEMGKDAAPVDPNAPPTRREDFPPAAMTMPPMPFTEWPYGGTTSLGVSPPNAVDSPFMNAISDTAFGQWMIDNHIQAYGWANAGFNFSNASVHGGNAPAAYSYNPNALALDQIVEYVERIPDMVQKDHNDWGFRASMIYGQDYRYTTSYGVMSGQYLNQNLANGWDAPMLYAEWYTPFVMQGLNIRVGRYISVPDIEAQLAPNNYMYSHSMTYAYDNYTNEGIIASLAVDRNWIIQAGIEGGTDSSLNHSWSTTNNPAPNALFPNKTTRQDPGANPAGTFAVRYTTDDGKTNLQATANGINSGTWGYNNLQWYGLTFYHTFDEHWHISSEVYQEHQNNVPNLNNSYVMTSNNGGPIWTPLTFAYNSPGWASCSNAAALTCTATAKGFVTYLNYQIDPLNNLSLRPEIYWDPQGQRTGTAATYRNLAFGWQHWFSPQIEVRPEIAYYTANKAAFNGNANLGMAPNMKNLTVFSGDIIWHW